MNRIAMVNNETVSDYNPHVRTFLQRKCTTCGNKSVAEEECTDCATKNSNIQRKLSIGASNDPLEHEADRVADQVLAMPSNTSIANAPLRIQRVSTQSNDSGMTAPSSVNHVLASSGSPMRPALKQDMEQRFGHDFSHVRLHTDSVAEQSTRDVSARAYTVGNNVVFGKGQYSPNSISGKRLLAHELTHVIQQGASSSIEKDATAGNTSAKSSSKLHTKLQRDCGSAADTIGSSVPCTDETSDPVGNRVLFNVNCDTFSGGGEQAVKDFADSMSDTDEVKVHGFASVDGETDFNLNLSCARSKKVADILETAGVSPAQVRLIRHGATAGPAAERRSVVMERVPGVSRAVVPQLSAVVSVGPAAGTCGGMNFVINWQLSRNSAANGGFVMQEVLFNWSVTDCTGTQVPNPDPRTSPLRYFEAWRVAPNSQNLSPVTTDTFFWPGATPWGGGCTDGNVSITASAKYHDNVTNAAMPAHMAVNNPATFAGGLRSSLVDPNLGGSVSRTVPHSLSFHWVCCPCSSSPTIIDQHTP